MQDFINRKRYNELMNSLLFKRANPPKKSDMRQISSNVSQISSDVSQINTSRIKNAMNELLNSIV